jgi:hypothetical protein
MVFACLNFAKFKPEASNDEMRMVWDESVIPYMKEKNYFDKKTFRKIFISKNWFYPNSTDF